MDKTIINEVAASNRLSGVCAGTDICQNRIAEQAEHIAQLESELAAAYARIVDVERLNVSTHDLKEGYKKGWIEWSGKAFRLRKLFKLANAEKRREREMRIEAQEANWEATKYIAAIGRVIGNDRDPNKMETTVQVIERIIKERDTLRSA